MHWTHACGPNRLSSVLNTNFLEDSVMYVIFGANGRAGGETARALIERGEPVRVVVRRAAQGERWKSLGAEVAVASLDNAAEVSDALDGATAAFLLNPPPVVGDPFVQTTMIATALTEAVPRANLPRAVVLSSVGAQHASGTGVIATLHQFEASLLGIAPATAFLRPGYFVDTWSEVAEFAVSDGVLPSFLPLDQKIPMVSTVDVGQAAARLLTQHWTGKRTVELGGPDDWSARDVAAAFGEVLGRPVEPTWVPPDERSAILAETGLPAEVVAALLGMYDGIASGRVAHQDGNEYWRGTTPLTAAVKRLMT